MGQPTKSHVLVPIAEHIGDVEATRGTETSKYPEEEKSTEIARVAASESAPAQTHACVRPISLLHVVLWDGLSGGLGRRRQLQSVMVVERSGKAGYRG